jgi:hypothetical protein
MCDKIVLNMALLTVKVSLQQLKSLLEVVDNQLFRMKFIDSRIPGHIPKPEELALATAAIDTLRKTYNKAMGITPHLKTI